LINVQKHTVVVLVGFLSQLLNAQIKETQPDIIIILADDMGYSDIGCYGGEIQTPNLDKLAKQGVRFTSFYNCARCCPTRASLLTGKYAQEVGLSKNESGKLWVDCTDKELKSKHMEAHAAMIDHMDQGIGKIIEKLKATGRYENTVIFFLSDNGASNERGYRPGFDRPGQTRSGEEILYSFQKYDRPGTEKTWGYLGDGWAGAINSPYRYWKIQSYEGGICTPLIVHWPNGLKGKENTLNKGIGHVMDILPTCMDLANANYPDRINGEITDFPEGKSILLLIYQGVRSTNDTLFWEHEGGRAARLGDWKITALKDKDWELFNLAEDRTETNNLALKNPEKLNQLNKLWMAWEKRVTK